MNMMLFSKLQLVQILESGITFELENTQVEEVQHKALYQHQKCHCKVTEVSVITVCLYCEGVGNWCYFTFLKEWNSKEALLSFPSSRVLVFCTHKPASQDIPI